MMRRNSDAQICELFKRREIKGMECLFEIYYRPLVLWCVTFLHDVDRSEDLVQDFFIKLWENKLLETLTPDTLKSYLFVSTRNLVLNAMVKVDPLRYACDISRFERPWEDYDDFDEEVLRRVEEAVSKLAPRSQDVIRCVYLEGMRYKEVAEKLNISVATVNTLLVNALKKLRQTSDGHRDILIYLFYIFSSK